MRVYVESYGCAQNQGEGAAISRALAERGHQLVGDPATAEAGVLVTCAVIGATEARMVRRWEELARRVPRVIVTGCLVPLRTGLLRGPARARTSFVPIREQGQLPILLDTGTEGPTATSRSETVAAVAPHPSLVEEVVIGQGCASGCAYCFSRLARGPLASVPPDEIVARVRRAAERGAAEIRLTSLDTSAWGRDRADGARLPDLLRAVAAVAGTARIRVGMMSPQTLGPILSEFLDAFRSPRCYRFLHLPVQSGSDRVLRAMHRGYTSAEFVRQVEEARARLPNLTLATDLIVGFPGETDEEHRASEELVAAVGPEIVNVTRFSPRPGTPAVRLRPVPPRVAKNRSRSLTALRQRLARLRLERWIGYRGTARVLEYGPGTSSVARLTNYLPVVLPSQPPLGSEVEVRVEGARSTYLLGRPSGAPV